MLSSSLDVDILDLKDVIDKYIIALTLLDEYDHDLIIKPIENKFIYIPNYNECIKIINSMKHNHDSKVFGLEKINEVLEGILLQINQFVFNVELYPSIEEKAAKLLYFIVKDHPFVDGEQTKPLKRNISINLRDLEFNKQKLYDSTFLSYSYKQKKNQDFKNLDSFTSVTPTKDELAKCNSRFYYKVNN